MSVRSALAALTLVAAWLWAGPARAQLLSPGPLAEAHADLDGDGNCSSCHSSGRQVENKKCLGCHTDLALRVSAGAGLHGRAYKGKDCAPCHVDHIGRKAKLIHWPGGAPGKLDHALTGWPLEGAHAGKDCGKCHTRKTSGGRATYLGQSTACGSCHKDPHEGRFGATCSTCHDQVAWKNVAFDKLTPEQFDHGKTRYPLRGKHGKVECKKCHGEPARWTGLAFGACSDCHEDPHEGKFKKFACATCHAESSWKELANFRGKHPGVRISAGHAAVACKDCHDRGNDEPPSKGSACVSCHPVVHEARFGRGCKDCHESIRWLGLPEATGRAAHDKTAYPLAGKHTSVDCARCHDPKQPAQKRFRELVFDRCLGCHADRHAGEFAARDGGECGACHAVAGFVPTRFGAAEHASTAFALDGRHQAAPCSTCHAGKRPRLDLRVAKRACSDCHANPHGNDFVAEIARDGCAGCHATAGWDRPRVDHSLWPLTGAHERTACVRCHGQVEGAAGSSARYRGVPRECDGCHADEHAGQFRLTKPVRACDRCHGRDVFDLPAFDHTALAGWALEGKHAAVACDGCHKPEKLHDGETSVRWRLGYSSCRACHADPHTAPARRGGESITSGMDCSACHAATGWALGGGAGDGGFDHARTGFPLLGAHRTTSCTSCHDGREVASACATCHEDSHAGRLGTACAECHSAVDWADTAALERHQRTRMPLTGRHALIECSACHVAAGARQWSNVPAECFACHEQDYRLDIHPDHDGDPADPALAPFARECGQCHRTSAWTPATPPPGFLAAKIRVPARHDARFVLSSGKHRGASCDACHADVTVPRLVACNGCHAHDERTLRGQHRDRAATGATSAAACLRCHPGGSAR